MELPPEIEAELKRAQQARERGNEGQARVCARRAAGLAARRFLAARGHRPQTASAYDMLGLIADDPALPADVREYASHLTLRVDEAFRLPAGIDLVAEARQLCRALLAAPPLE
jgi:HEPN domain-containing protein